MGNRTRIVVDPAHCLVDEVVDVRVTGLEPGLPFVLRADTVDEAGCTWSSHATLVASDGGEVSLRTATPVDGDWTRPDPMAFIWAMTPSGVQCAGRYSQPGLKPSLVALSAVVEGEVVARASMSRVFVAADVRRSDIRADGLVATLFEPSDREPISKATVVVLGGSLGGLENARAALIASHGFPALAVAYFGISPLPGSLVEIPLEYFGRAFEFIVESGLGTHGRIGVMGTSRGGELALLLASRFSAVGGVVAYVPSGIVHYGIPQGGDNTRLQSEADPLVRPPAWTEGGRGLRGGSVAYNRVDFSQPLVRFAPGFREGLKDAEATADARIPLGHFTGPVAMFSGTDDQVWPSSDLAVIAERGLTASSYVEHIVYSGAGHSIGHPYLPTTVHSVPHPLNSFEIALGGSNHADAAACADSWQRALRVLDSI
jgi:dienelactone hydrolase